MLVGTLVHSIFQKTLRMDDDLTTDGIADMARRMVSGQALLADL